MDWKQTFRQAATGARQAADAAVGTGKAAWELREVRSQLHTEKLALADLALDLYAKGALTDEAACALCAGIVDKTDRARQLAAELRAVRTDTAAALQQAGADLRDRAQARAVQARQAAGRAGRNGAGRRAGHSGYGALCCPDCGAPLQEKFQFCPACGLAIETVDDIVRTARRVRPDCGPKAADFWADGEVDPDGLTAADLGDLDLADLGQAADDPDDTVDLDALSADDPGAAIDLDALDADDPDDTIDLDALDADDTGAAIDLDALGLAALAADAAELDSLDAVLPDISPIAPDTGV